MGVFIFFFFFQAEDGIRDGHVTGVQTCALPIFFDKETGVLLWHASDYNHEKDAKNLGAAVRPLALFRAGMVMRVGLEDARSEERRVGKECRSGGRGEELKKKGDKMRTLGMYRAE